MKTTDDTGEPAGSEEERLRARFAELRRHDERRVPDFQQMRAAPRRIRSPWRVVMPAASLAAAAMFMLWCGARSVLLESSTPQAAAPAAAPALTSSLATDETAFDPAPLEFLLDVPGTAPSSVRASFDSNPLHGW